MCSSMTLILLLIELVACNVEAARWKRATCSNTGLTDDNRNQILTYHNDARRRVAQGKEPNNVGTLNPARNMYKLEWNCTMEQQAQQRMDQCTGSIATWPSMAQNVITWTSSGGFSNPSSQIKSSQDSWWGAAKKYGVTDKDNKYTNSQLYSFANMVFSETTKIGCAYKVCSTRFYFTCLYDGIGYFTNAPMWETGTACAQGTECTTYPNSMCDNGLCVKGAPIPDTNNLCPANNGSIDLVRQQFLQMHNNFRSSVARGLEPDKLGGNAPKAAKMLQMKYDCDVEASALRHAAKCVYEHSSDAARPGLGENIYRTSAVGFDKVKAATQASQLWWNELKDYGVGPSNNLTLALWNRPNTQIGHYTQMAWDRTYRLGCAVAHCPSFTFGVCQYGPAGNYFNQLIYTIGEPCSSCPTSSTCNATSGLCVV